jgi:hypothetical protein
MYEHVRLTSLNLTKTHHIIIIIIYIRAYTFGASWWPERIYGLDAWGHMVQV